jgi:hypothetical protein
MMSCLENETEFPIFSACEYKNIIFLSGGGGGQKFGVKNILEIRNRMDLTSLHSENLNETLIEGLFALEENDSLIAYSDTKLFYYEILSDGKINLKKQLDFKVTDFSDFIKVFAYDNYVLVYDNEKMFRIYEIKNKDLLEVFKIEISEKIFAFQVLPQIDKENVYILLKNEIMVFSLKEKKFVDSFLKNYSFLKSTHLAYLKDNLFLMIMSDRDCTQIVFLKKQTKSEPGFKIVKQKKLLNLQISTFNLKNNILVLSTVEGIIKIYEINELEVNLLLSSKLHSLPVKSILIRELPSKEKDKNIIISTFGLDYKIKTFEISPGKIHHSYRYTMLSYFVLFILFFAVFAGYFIK